MTHAEALPFQRISGADNLGLGTDWLFVDLDDPAILASYLDVSGGTIDELRGPSTFNPIGFSIPELMGIFYDTKKLHAASDFPGSLPDDFITNFAGTLAAITARREALFCQLPSFATEAPGGLKVSLGLIPAVGLKSGGRYFPPLGAQASWHRASDNTDGTVTTVGGPSRMEVGSLHFWGRTAPIFETFDLSGTPGGYEFGDITITVAETWPG